MKFYRFALFKAYFDKGYGVTSYLKYLIAAGGFAAVIDGMKPQILIFIFLFYGFTCFFIGKLWYKYKIADAEKEVDNNINPFVREMRLKFNNHKI